MFKRIREILCFHNFESVPPLIYLPRRICKKCGLEQRYIMGVSKDYWKNVR